jgi:hypothetical protein
MRTQPFGADSDPSNIVDAGYTVGSIQVTGGTQPIVLHRDAVSGGGYAMVATVISADMDLIARAAPGTATRFVPVDMETALTARRERAVLLSEAIRPLAPHHARIASISRVTGSAAPSRPAAVRRRAEAGLHVSLTVGALRVGIHEWEPLAREDAGDLVGAGPNGLAEFFKSPGWHAGLDAGCGQGACASSRWRAPRRETSSSCPPKVRPTAMR